MTHSQGHPEPGVQMGNSSSRGHQGHLGEQTDLEWAWYPLNLTNSGGVGFSSSTEETKSEKGITQWLPCMGLKGKKECNSA